MLSLTHTLISLPFAVYFHHPALIFFSAFTWHLLADTLLHWNLYPDLMKKQWFYPLVALDIIAGLLLAYLVIGANLWTLPYLTVIFAGNLPDIMHGLWDLAKPWQAMSGLKWAAPWFVWHDALQLETKTFWLGMLSQIALITVSLYLVV